MPAALRWTGTAIGIAVLWSLSATVILVWLFGLWEAVGELPPWAIPFQWFVFALHYRDHHQVPENLAISAAGATILAAAALAQQIQRKPKPLHGTSAFATWTEAKRSGLEFARRPRGDSILLGRTAGFLGLGRRYLCAPGTDHSALYARTGAGKTAGHTVPCCLAWCGSLAALDIKGELYATTAGHRHRMGQEVFFFAPTAPDGRSHRYNPFSVVPRGEVGCIDAIHRIMNLLVPTPPGCENPFWPDGARALGSAGAVLLAESPGEPLNLAAVLRMFTRPDHRAFIRGLIQRARDAGAPLPRTAVDTVLAWMGSDDPKTREGFVSELKARLSLYASPQIAAATEASDFDLRDLRTKPMSIYLGIGPADLRRLRPLVALLFQQLIDVNCQELWSHARHEHRVLMMLDEFASAGPLTTLADGVSFVRGYGLRMAFVVQTKSQLVSLYGPEGAENLFENTFEVCFGLKGVKLAREVSEMAGTDTVTETSHSRPRFMGWMNPAKQTENEAARGRALLLPQEVMRLPQDEQLVFRPGMMPLRTRRFMWFEDAWFRSLGWSADPRVKALGPPAPPVPPLDIRIERDAGASTADLAAEEEQEA